MARALDPDRHIEEIPTGVILRAVLAVLVAERESRTSDTDHMRTELLLAEVGIDYRDIASLLGKKPDAVRMLISRARNQPKKA